MAGRISPRRGSLGAGRVSLVAARVDWHNRGLGPRYTAFRHPVQLVHSEEFRTLPEAVARERQLKAWNGPKKEALIAGDMAARHLARTIAPCSSLAFA
jgi:putative endonuclease